MKVTVVPIVVDALEQAPKCLERGLEQLEIRGRIETIQTTTALLRSARILRRNQRRRAVTLLEVHHLTLV